MPSIPMPDVHKALGLAILDARRLTLRLLEVYRNDWDNNYTDVVWYALARQLSTQYSDVSASTYLTYEKGIDSSLSGFWVNMCSKFVSGMIDSGELHGIRVRKANELLATMPVTFTNPDIVSQTNRRRSIKSHDVSPASWLVAIRAAWGSYINGVLTRNLIIAMPESTPDSARTSIYLQVINEILDWYDAITSGSHSVNPNSIAMRDLVSVSDMEILYTNALMIMGIRDEWYEKRDRKRVELAFSA